MNRNHWNKNIDIIDRIANNEGHTMVLGASGTGKTRRLLIPLIHSYITSGQSAIIVDPKGEIKKATIGLIKDKNCVTHVLDFRDLVSSEGINILWLPYQLYMSKDINKQHKSYEMVANLANTIFFNTAKDIFWANSAKSLFLGLTFLLFKTGKPSEINVSSVLHMFVDGRERYAATSTMLSELKNLYKDNSIINLKLDSYLSLTANETKSCIGSQFLEDLSAFSLSPALESFLSRNDFSICDIEDDKQTLIYIILPDESDIYYKISGIILSQLSSHYLSLAQEQPSLSLRKKLNISIDELGNIGYSLKNLPSLLSSGRSRNISVQFVLQSMNQLDNIYGYEAKTIIDNSTINILFRVFDWKTLQDFSNRCGEKIYEYRNGNKIALPLITTDILGGLKLGQALVIINGSYKFITNLKDYTETFNCDDEKDSYSSKSEISIISPNTFDIKPYVMDAKRKAQSAPKKDPPIQVKSTFMDNIDIDKMLKEIDVKIAKFEDSETN